IVVPGGFGSRGMDGKVVAIKYARKNNIPFFGVCLGLQLAAVEIARNELDLTDANTQEADETTAYPIVCPIQGLEANGENGIDRKSTRLNSSHVSISYAVFC